MTFQRRIRQLHKILAIIVFIQVFMWMLSGLYMTAVPIDKVRGQHLVDINTPAGLDSASYLPIAALLSEYPQVKKIELFSRIDQPVYRLTTDMDEILLHATTGEAVALLGQEQASEMAKQSYRGNGQIKQVSLITDMRQAPEVRGRELPVWQVSFDDFWATSIYLSAEQARIVAVRSDLWRWFDFLWMLHIMDYQEREDFNNPLIILMASLGLLMTTSGILMIAQGMRKKGLKYIG